MWFFFQLEKIEPESWELNLIRRFDAVVMEIAAKNQQKANASKK